MILHFNLIVVGITMGNGIRVMASLVVTLLLGTVLATTIASAATDFNVDTVT